MELQFGLDGLAKPLGDHDAARGNLGELICPGVTYPRYQVASSLIGLLDSEVGRGPNEGGRVGGDAIQAMSEDGPPDRSILLHALGQLGVPTLPLSDQGQQVGNENPKVGVDAYRVQGRGALGTSNCLEGSTQIPKQSSQREQIIT